MKTKFLIQLFLLAFVSFSLYSCTAETVEEAAQKNKVVPKITTPVAEEGDNPIVEPIVVKPK